MIRAQVADAGNRQIAGTLLLLLTVAYLLLAVLPFYLNGIYLRPTQEILGSLVDPKGYPPFVWFAPLSALGALVAGYLPFLSLVLAPMLALGLLWGRPGRSERALWLLTIAANIATVALTWQVRGLIGLWLAD